MAACVDAITYLKLGVFPANMTGNTVLLAIGVGGDGNKAADAAHSATALGGFVVGAVLAGAARGRADSVRAFLVLAWSVELAAFGGTIAIALAAPASTFPQIALLGLAMGIQSATVAQLGVGVSTTYLTGTWTAVSSFVGRSAGRRVAEPSSQPVGRQIAVLASYFAAAAVAVAVTRAI